MLSKTLKFRLDKPADWYHSTLFTAVSAKRFRLPIEPNSSIENLSREEIADFFRVRAYKIARKIIKRFHSNMAQDRFCDGVKLFEGPAPVGNMLAEFVPDDLAIKLVSHHLSSQGWKVKKISDELGRRLSIAYPNPIPALHKIPGFEALSEDINKHVHDEKQNAEARKFLSELIDHITTNPNTSGTRFLYSDQRLDLAALELFTRYASLNIYELELLGTADECGDSDFMHALSRMDKGFGGLGQVGYEEGNVSVSSQQQAQSIPKRRLGQPKRMLGYPGTITAKDNP